MIKRVFVAFIFVYASFNARCQDSLSYYLNQLDTSRSLEIQFYALDKISNYYELIGDDKNALIYSRKFTRIKDSLFDLNFTKSSIEIEDKTGLNKANKKLLQSQDKLTILTKKKTNLLNLLWRYKYLSFGTLIFVLFFLNKIRLNRKLNKEILFQKEAVIKKHKKLEANYSEIYQALEILTTKSQVEKNSKSELPDWVVKLSKKELEVLSYLTIGMTDKEISQKMNVSLSTTRTYCRRLYTKLLVKNRSEAANFAVKHNLI